MKNIILSFILLTNVIAFSQNTTSARNTQFNVENSIAIKGYDPVAYFTQNKAVKGSAKIASQYGGITYYFANQANKKVFDANPAQYEPQYGGWCAYAMGDSGEKIEIDPKTFKINDGKLYLFYNFYFTNTLKSWNKDEKNLKVKADQNWSKTFKH